MIKKIISFLTAAIFIGFGSDSVSAATFNLNISKQSFAVNEDFTVELHMDSQGVGINAAQGTIRFPSDILEVKSIDKTESVFNFWLQEPVVSANKDSISFTGGSTSGFSGQSLYALKIVFHVKGSGSGSISVTDGAITASDGSGTNVLVGGKGIDISSSSGSSGPGTLATITPVIPPITPITREAVPSEKSPVRPDARISLYPDAESWYSGTAPFLVEWSLPNDITDVATSINKDPTGVPSKSEGLFDNKTFASLTDGIWYLHVRFRNNIGWGPTFHRRIAVDTNPPLPFEISSSSGLESDNPSPVLSFETTDQPSGILRYSVTVGSAEPINVEKGSINLPLQSPGDKKVKVVAFDKAGNFTEKIVDLKVIPISLPTVSFITGSFVVGDEMFEARGGPSQGIP